MYHLQSYQSPNTICIAYTLSIKLISGLNLSRKNLSKENKRLIALKTLRWQALFLNQALYGETEIGQHMLQDLNTNRHKYAYFLSLSTPYF